jgi:hypothetical protein
MTTLVYTTHIRRPSRFRSLINLIGIPLVLILITLLHYLPLMSLEVTPGMKDGTRIPTGAHPPRTVSRRQSFRPSPHTPKHLSNIRPSILPRACSLTLVFPFQSIPPPLRRLVPFDVAPSQWSEPGRGALRIRPPRTRVIPRHRKPLKNTLRPRRRENAPTRSSYES